MKIVFMGTPDFAVTALEALIQAGKNIAAVVTVADKPAGRGQKVQESAIKQYAVAHNLPVLQPIKLKDPVFLDKLRAIQADLFVVVAFRMLPDIVWQMPPKGTINLHASLLPKYRGAAPIHHAIINGEKETGVTTFFLKQEIDTGNIIFSDRLPIADDETTGNLYQRLGVLGANLLVKTVKAIEEGNYTETPQSEAIMPIPAPKIFKDFCEINWSRPNAVVYNHIRGLSPYPTAFTSLQGKTLKVFNGQPESVLPTIAAGEFLTDGKTFLKFATNDGYIYLTDIQYEGKKRMAITDFLRGVRL